MIKTTVVNHSWLEVRVMLLGWWLLMVMRRAQYKTHMLNVTNLRSMFRPTWRDYFWTFVCHRLDTYHCRWFSDMRLHPHRFIWGRGFYHE